MDSNRADLSKYSSVGEVKAHDTALLQSLAQEFNLTYTAFGSHITEEGAPAYGTLTLSDEIGRAHV